MQSKMDGVDGQPYYTGIECGEIATSEEMILDETEPDNPEHMEKTAHDEAEMIQAVETLLEKHPLQPEAASVMEEGSTGTKVRNRVLRNRSKIGPKSFKLRSPVRPLVSRPNRWMTSATAIAIADLEKKGQQTYKCDLCYFIATCMYRLRIHLCQHYLVCFCRCGVTSYCRDNIIKHQLKIRWADNPADLLCTRGEIFEVDKASFPEFIKTIPLPYSEFPQTRKIDNQTPSYPAQHFSSEKPQNTDLPGQSQSSSSTTDIKKEVNSNKPVPIVMLTPISMPKAPGASISQHRACVENVNLPSNTFEKRKTRRMSRSHLHKHGFKQMDHHKQCNFCEPLRISKPLPSPISHLTALQPRVWSALPIVKSVKTVSVTPTTSASGPRSLSAASPNAPPSFYADSPSTTHSLSVVSASANPELIGLFRDSLLRAEDELHQLRRWVLSERPALEDVADRVDDVVEILRNDRRCIRRT